MKKLSILAVLTMIFSTVAQAYTTCTYSYDRWGNRTRVCRTTHHRPAPNPVGDAVVVGAVAGATAGLLLSSCAPEVVEGNISATDRVLLELSASEDFQDAQTFQALVSSIVATEDTQEKMGQYFTLVDVKDATEIAYFLGARDNELAKYAQALEAKADLSSEQSDKVVRELAKTLRGSLR